MVFKTLWDFLFSTGLPAFFSVLLIWMLGGPKNPWRTPLQALILAAGLAFSGFFHLEGFHLPPIDAGHAFPVALGLLALFVVIAPLDVGRRYMLRAVFAVILGALVLWPILPELRGQVHVRNLLAFFFLGLGVWSIMEGGMGKVRSPALIALPLISVGGLSYIFALKGGQGVDFASAELTVYLAGLLAVALIAPERLSGAALIPFLSLYVVLLMLAAHFYLRFNPWLMIYLCFPYLILWIRRWFPFVPKQPLLESLFLSIMSLLPLIYLVRSIETGHG